MLKSHCNAGFAKASAYSYDPVAINQEKLLGPSPIVPSNSELASVDDSVVIHQRGHRLTRSASCGQLSATDGYKLHEIWFIILFLYLTILNSTTIPLSNISDQSIFNANSLSTITTSKLYFLSGVLSHSEDQCSQAMFENVETTFMQKTKESDYLGIF